MNFPRNARLLIIWTLFAFQASGANEDSGFLETTRLGMDVYYRTYPWIDQRSHLGSSNEQGRVVRYDYVLDHGLKIRIGERANFSLDGSLDWHHGYLSDNTLPHTRLIKMSFQPQDLSLSYHLRKQTAHSAAKWVQIGLIPVKYNPSATYFGEYLYRYNSYPGIPFVPSNPFYDPFPLTRHLKGLRGVVSNSDETLLFQGIVELHAEDWDEHPGLSLGMDGAWKPWTPFEMGAGFNFYRLFATRARDLETWYNGYVQTPQGAYLLADTSQQAPGDTGYFAAAGLNVVLRAALELPARSLPGSRDTSMVRTFAEAALLGVRNQPVLYAEITRRMPISFGIHLAALWMDWLSLEWEYRRVPVRRLPFQYRIGLWDVDPDATDNKVGRIVAGRYLPGWCWGFGLAKHWGRLGLSGRLWTAPAGYTGNGDIIRGLHWLARLSWSWR